MLNRSLMTRSLAAVLAAIVISSAVFAEPSAGSDFDEAVKAAVQMRQPLLDGNRAECERLGTLSIEYARKALSAEKNSENQKYLEAAIRYLEQTLKDVRDDKFGYAAQSWNEALKMYDYVS